MSEPIQFYKHQIKAEYHNHDGKVFNYCLCTRCTKGDTDDLLGALWLLHYEDEEDTEVVYADSLFYPTVQAELAKMLEPTAYIMVVEGFGIAINEEGLWVTSAGLYDGSYEGGYPDLRTAIREGAEVLAREAYEAATDRADKCLVEDLYRTYFSVENLLKANNNVCTD